MDAGTGGELLDWVKVTGPVGTPILVTFEIAEGDCQTLLVPGSWNIADMATLRSGATFELQSVRIEAQARLNIPPPLKVWTHSGICMGAGTVTVCGSSGGGCHSGGPLLNSVTTLQNSPQFPHRVEVVGMYAHPRTDYSFSHWMANGVRISEGPGMAVYWPEAPIVAYAHLEEKPQLSFVIKEAQGVSGEPIPCIGYCTADPAMKYYDKNQLVAVTAHEQPGSVFLRWWEPQGTAFLDAGGTVIKSLDDENDPVTQSPIWIKLKDSQSAPKSRTLDAIFYTCACGPRNGCTALTALEFADEQNTFPRLQECNVCKERDATCDYNCVGHTLGIDGPGGQVWYELDDYVGPRGHNGIYGDELDFDNFYNVKHPGVPAILYGGWTYIESPYPVPGWYLVGMHVAIPLEDNCASSKIGKCGMQMRHNRNELEGDFYGNILKIYNSQ